MVETPDRSRHPRRPHLIREVSVVKPLRLEHASWWCRCKQCQTEQKTVERRTWKRAERRSWQREAEREVVQ